MIRSNFLKRSVSLLRSPVSSQFHRIQRTLPTNLVSTISTAPRSIEKIRLPPNLKIDDRSKNSRRSPFKSNVEVITEEEEYDDIESEEGEEGEENIEEVDDDEDDDDDDEVVWFVPPQPKLTIPLPERLNVPVIDRSDLSTEVGKFHLSASVFGQDPIRVDIMKRVVQYQRNKKRAKRTAKSKTISEVSGSGKKVRNQKGGGIARAGHKRPAHWRGGAKAHGPKGIIQDYTTKLNKHTRKLGLVNALSQKLKEQNLIVVNDLMLETHRTKDFSELLRAVGLSGKKGIPVLLVDWLEEEDERGMNNLPVHLVVAGGNIPNVKTISQGNLNVYDVLKHEKLIITLSAVSALEQRLDGVTY